MAELGLNEPYDLEQWLASSGGGLFDREVLWIARQDRAADDERSDLLGVDQEGNLLVTELKRGLLYEGAVTQALGYTAEYAGKTPQDLAELYATHSEKHGNTGLLAKAESQEDAQKRLSTHVGADTEVNEAQIIVLVAEDFTAKSLAICDYLNNASGEASFSVECWQYTVFKLGTNDPYFVLEQVLPPPNVRQAIDEKREASKGKKYARDPVRIDFMYSLLAYLSDKQVSATRSRGASYECRMHDKSWAEEHDLIFSVHADHPRLILGEDVELAGDVAEHQVTSVTHWDNRPALEFSDVDCRTVKFGPLFGDRLIAVVQQIRPKPASDAEADSTVGTAAPNDSQEPA